MSSSRSYLGIAKPPPDLCNSALHHRILATGIPGLRKVNCEWRNGVVVLWGRVPSFYIKQLAQAIFLVDPAIRTVENLIEVVKAEE